MAGLEGKSELVRSLLALADWSVCMLLGLASAATRLLYGVWFFCLNVACGSTCDSRAALAEIDRREGYEVRLLAALRACTTPLTPR